MTPAIRHDVLVITYNRPHYTRMALEQLLKTCDESMRVWIWHNGDHQPTIEVVRSLQSHPRIYKAHFSTENLRLREPTNWFYRESDAPYLSKVDDDCLVPEGWSQTIIAAHEANPNLGVVGCWVFYDEDFVPELAEKKMVELAGGHRLMRNCWTPGSGYVMKRDCLSDIAAIPDGMSFTQFCIQLELRGWINGFYFPFLHEEHMDDGRSPYFGLQTEEDFQANRPLSAMTMKVESLAEWKRISEYAAYECQSCSPDPRVYVGWRAKLRSAKARISRAFGAREPWRV